MKNARERERERAAPVTPSAADNGWREDRNCQFGVTHVYRKRADAIVARTQSMDPASAQQQQPEIERVSLLLSPSKHIGIPFRM